MIREYHSVFFDLDGTIADSVPLLTVGVNELMSSLRMRPFSEKEVALMVGKGARRLLERVCDARGIFPTEQTLRTLERKYQQVSANLDQKLIRVFPGVREGIESLRNMGILTGIVTNKSLTMTQEFLVAHELEDLFQEVLTADDVDNPKPAPGMVKLACRRTACEPKNVLIVGDSRNDALAARAAGCDVVLVKTGYNEGVPIDQWARENDFPFVCDDLAAACRWVESVAPPSRIAIRELLTKKK